MANDIRITGLGMVVGFIAQEFEKVFPDYVTKENDSTLGIRDLRSINVSPVLPYLVASVQALKKKIDDLQSQINELKLLIKNK